MLTVNPIKKIQGRISVPGDKSISHRAVMLSGISQGKSRIRGFLRGNDCLSTIACFRGLGIEIQEDKQEILIMGKGLHGLTEPKDILDAGNSGTTMRLIAGILAGQNFLSLITGDDSLKKRPMDRITGPLKEMGAKIDGRCGGSLAPLVIRGGGLQGMDYTLPVPSAQVKSAVLLAGLYAEGETIVREETAARDHTERMLKFLGANITTENGVITLKSSILQGGHIEVPGDISSAAFFIAAAAAFEGAHLVIEKVGLNPTRTGIIDVLRNMGADIEFDRVYTSGGEKIGDIIVRGKKLHGSNIDGEIIPRLIDEIPVIAVIASVAEGKTTIRGAEELKVKESNRIAAMVSELQKRGVAIEELSDGMEINGPNEIQGGIAESYGDHRIAMAMAVCALFAKDPIKIKDPECIGISFPQFEEKLKAISR